MSRKEIIKGKNLIGENRTYAFNLMNARTGFRLFHKHAARVQILGPALVGKVSENKEPGEFDPEKIPVDKLQIVQFVPTFFPELSDVEELCKEMLAGCLLTTDTKSVTFDSDGFADVDPIETYLALFYAVVANYRSYVAPLLDALVVQGEDDSIPDQDGDKTSKSASE